MNDFFKSVMSALAVIFLCWVCLVALKIIASGLLLLL